MMHSASRPGLFPGHITRPAAWLIVLWILSMISLPIIRWTVGDGAIPPAVSLAVFLQAAAVVLVLGAAWGVRRTAMTALAVMAMGWGVEALGSKTGIPFGSYDYTALLQPQLWGVPVIVPLAWLMMLPPAWAVARSITGACGSAAFIIVSALAFTAWDLFLDPQMVAWNFWIWDNPSGYFGIPWVNYLGWLLSAALITLVLRPRRLPLFPLLVIYTVTWILEMIGLVVFWGLVGPGLAGGVIMGAFTALAWRRFLLSRDVSSAAR